MRNSWEHPVQPREEMTLSLRSRAFLAVLPGVLLCGSASRSLAEPLPPPPSSAAPPLWYPPPDPSAAPPPTYAPPPGATASSPYPYPYYPYAQQPVDGSQAYPYAYPQPNYPPPPAPAAPAPRKGSHLHDGFFLQFTAGPTLHRGHLALSNTNADASLRGTGMGYGFAMGGTIARGWVLGGLFGGHSVNAELSNNNSGKIENSNRLTYTSFSIFTAWYPDPTKGLHFQAALGSAQHEIADLRVTGVPGASGRQNYDVGTQNGTHFMLGVGYETFVSDEWSIGALLRLEAASFAQSEEPKADGTMFAPTLQLSFTYH